MHHKHLQAKQPQRILYISLDTSLDKEKGEIPHLINVFKEPGNEAEEIKKMAEGLIEKIRLYCKSFLGEEITSKPISPEIQKKLHKGGMRLFGKFYEIAGQNGAVPTEEKFVESMRISKVLEFARGISQDVIDEDEIQIS